MVSPPPKRRSRWRTLLKRGLIVCVALAVLVFVFRHRTAGWALRQIAAQQGLQLRFEALTGSLWSDVELRGVHVASHPEDATFDVRATHLAAEYDLFELASGNLEGLRRLRTDALRGELELVASEPKATAPSPQPIAWPAQLPELDLDVESLAVTLADDSRWSLESARIQNSGDDANLYEIGATRLRRELGEERRDTSLRARLRYGPGRVEVEELRAGHALDAHGVFEMVEGLPTWQLTARALNGNLRSTGVVRESELEFELALEALSLQELFAFGRVPLQTDPTGHLYATVTGAMRNGVEWPSLEGEVRLKDAVVASRTIDEFRARVHTPEELPELRELRISTLDSTLEVERLSIGSIASLEEAIHGAAGELRVQSPDLGRLLYLEADAAPPIAIEITGTLERGVASLQKSSLTSGTSTVAVDRGRVRFGQEPETLLSEAEFDLAFRATIDELADFRQLLESEAWSGSLQATGEVRGVWPDVQGNGSLEATQFVTPRAQFDELSTDLVFADGRFDLRRFQSRGPGHELNAEGEVTLTETGFELDVSRLSVAHEDLDLKLLAPAKCVLEKSRPVALTPFELRGSAGHVRLELAENDPQSLIASIEDLNTRGLLAPFWPAAPSVERFAGTVRASWDESSWTSASADLAMRGLRFEDQELTYDGELQGTWKENRLSLTEFRLGTPEHDVLRLNGSVGLSAEGLLEEEPIEVALEFQSLTGQVSLPSAWQAQVPARADINLRLDLGGDLTHPRGDGSLTLTKLELAGQDNRERVYLSPSTLHTKLRFQDSIELENLEWTGPGQHRVQGGGTLHTPADWRLLTGDAETPWTEIGVSANATLSSDSLPELGDWLRDWFDVPSSFRAGHVEGQVAVSGTMGALNPIVDLAIRDAIFRIRGVPPITNLASQVRYEAPTLELSELKGELGASPFEARAKLDLAGEEARIEGELRGDELLLLRNSSVKVRADVDLTLEGTMQSPLLMGTAQLSQARMVSPIEVLDINFKRRAPPRRSGLRLFRLSDPPLRDVRFDIQVGSRAPFEIDNNLVKGSVRPDLRLTGTGEVPTLAGTIYLDPTRVSMPAQDVEVRSGTILFSEEDPFYPQVEILAEQRSKGYDIDIRVTGRYDQPEVHLTSTPPLASDALALLVLTGQTPDADRSRTGKRAAQSVAVYLAQDYLSRWLSSSDPEAEASWFERFELRTGRDITRSGGETMEGSFRLDRLKSKDRDAFYLTAESDQYDFINFGLRFELRIR